MSGMPEKWEVNVLGRAPRCSFPRRLRLLPAGTSAFFHSRLAHPAPSARVAWLFYQHGGRESSRRWKGGGWKLRRCSSHSPRSPPFSFTSFNLQGKDFINMNGERVRRLLGPPSARGLSGAGPRPSLGPPGGRAGFRRFGGAGRVRPGCGAFSPGLLPRQLLVATVIRLSVLVRGQRGKHASDSRFRDSPVC